MTELTDEAVKTLLDGTTPGPWYWEETHPENACAVVRAKSEDGHDLEIATLYGCTDDVPAPTMPDEPWGDHPIRRADAALCAAAPDLARALLDARADAQAAVALVVERFVHECEQNATYYLGAAFAQAAKEARQLAPADGLAAVEALLKEREAKLVEAAEARVWHEAAKEARECDYPWASPTNEQADACDQMAERIADWLDSRAKAAALRQGDTP